MFCFGFCLFVFVINSNCYPIRKKKIKNKIYPSDFIRKHEKPLSKANKKKKKKEGGKRLRKKRSARVGFELGRFGLRGKGRSR